MIEINKIENALQGLRKQLINHDLYTNIKSIEDIQIFMQIHIFAVWDFMSLLKALQNELTNTSIPWTPTGDKLTRRLVNEIVLCEESDYYENNEPASHFEMYIDAMKQINADTAKIENFISSLQKQIDYKSAFDVLDFRHDIKNDIKDFIDFTFDIIKTKKVHIIASVFTFGRENLIPSMFIKIVRRFNTQNNSNLSKFVYYLDRHIQVDEEEHGPMALNMIRQLCGNDSLKWLEAQDVCVIALEKRIKLWDSINKEILANNT